MQARTVAAALRKRGFKGVEFVDRTEKKLSFLDGLKVLLEDEKSNLGWRIVAGSKMKEDDLKDLLKQTESEDSQAMSAIIPTELKKSTKAMLTLLRKVRDGKPINSEDVALLETIGVEPLKLGLEALSDELNAGSQKGIKPGLRRLTIKVTTVEGSKGLAADVVFITHFDDQFMISKKGIVDKDVCKFLVALTRARKKVFLLSSQALRPTFLGWINEERIAVE